MSELIRPGVCWTHSPKAFADGAPPRYHGAVIRGEKVTLRPRRESDVQPLYDGLYSDVPGTARTSAAPWLPTQPGRSQYARALNDPDERTVTFSVVESVPPGPDAPDGERLVGDAVLWGVDAHNRNAHLGLSLLPSARGRGLGSDIVRVLCVYGFTVRGLRRLEINTLADNHAMLTVAERCGFVREGVRRRAAWVYGEFLDEVVLGLLREDWHPADDGRPTPPG